jgi:hypothetical protein
VHVDAIETDSRQFEQVGMTAYVARRMNPGENVRAGSVLARAIELTRCGEIRELP